MKKKLLIVTVLAIFGLAMLSLTSSRPANLGVVNGSLAALPNSPNGVSRVSIDDGWKKSAVKYWIRTSLLTRFRSRAVVLRFQRFG